MALSSDRAVGGSRAEGWRAETEVVGRRVGVPVLIAIAVLTAITAGAGLLVTGPLGAVDSLDREVTTRLVDARTPALDDLTAVVGRPADTIPVAVLWVGAMVAAAWWTRRWEVPVFLLAAVGGEKLTYLASSLLVGRPRPDVPPLGHVFSTSSFPSGHVAAAVTLYGGLVVAGLWLDAGRRGRPRSALVVAALAAAVVVLAVLVAVSRTYRGHHHLSDVVWGALLGATWLWVAWRLVLHPADPPARHA